MIKTTAKLDNIMEYKILNNENYARIMETLGETHELDIADPDFKPELQ